MINTYEPGLQFYADKINNNEKFSFNRMGNGEWDCILGLYPRTRSGSQIFTPDLRTELTKVVTNRHDDSNSILAMQNTPYLEKIDLLSKIEPWLKDKPAIQWHMGDVFHRANRDGELAPFMQAIKKHRVVVVGPPWLMSLPFCSVYVPVVEKNCWSNVDELADRLSGLSDVIISFSAGPTTKVLIHRLFPIIGKSCWMLDAGSMWDPYCGVNSRKYHKLMTAETFVSNGRGI